MKPSKFFLPAIILSYFLSSCATLTKSQLNEVNAFGQLTSNFSAFPGTIVSNYNQVHRQTQIYRANSLAKPEAHVEAIAIANDFAKVTNPYEQKIDLSLKIVDQYAQGLILLTSNKHNKTLDTAATKFGTNLDGLVSTYNKIDPGAKLPTGIGAAVAAVITFGGDIYIRSKQAEDVKQVVPMGDVIIEKITINLLTFLGPIIDTDRKEGLAYMIRQERITIANNYIAYLRLNRDDISIDRDKENFSGFIKHERFASISDDKDYLKMLQDLDGAELLRQQCVQAVIGLRKAHAKLLQDIQQKVTLKQFAQELQDYGSEVQTIYKTIKAIK
ncbi:MAG TPA: hypothetical protein VGN20_07575 [Mucilaginibacter sp.]|jgi:hypothetical protein